MKTFDHASLGHFRVDPGRIPRPSGWDACQRLHRRLNPNGNRESPETILHYTGLAGVLFAPSS